MTCESRQEVQNEDEKESDRGVVGFCSGTGTGARGAGEGGWGSNKYNVVLWNIRAYIDGIEVDSMEVVVNKLDQDLKVTYKGKSSVTFKEADLKKEMKRITLVIKGDKTKITATKSSTSLYFIPSTKKLTLYKGIKKGDYTFKVKAEASKYYNSKSVTFIIHIE